jgi:hydroxymethylglutaryl-CoA lyase
MSISKSRRVTVFEVGVRDGLQNEKLEVTTSQKIKLLEGLVQAGVRELEVGAFVRPDRVPQMADTQDLYRKLKLPSAVRSYALIPNERGLERALECGVKSIALFTATSESFNRANIGMSVKETFEIYSRMMPILKKHRIRVRGYLSTVWGCPFEGAQRPLRVLRLTEKFFELGVAEVSLGDTIGVGDPRGVEKVLSPLLKNFRASQLAGHFHDTYGRALANALRALDLGIRRLDSSVGGLGGCPFAPGATGNLATEDLVSLLHEMGFHTGVDLEKLCRVSSQFSKAIRRPITSRVLQAWSAKQ